VRRRLRESEHGGNSAVLARHPSVRRAAAPQGQVFLAVHRHDLNVYYKRLEPEAYRILRAIGNGAALGEALAAGFQDSPMAEDQRPEFLRRSFHDWAAFGWFAVPGGPHA
jgi:hypothetical protein